MHIQAISIKNFCAAHNISRATFYNLMKAQNAPATMLVGRRRLISTEAAQAWREKMTVAPITILSAGA